MLPAAQSSYSGIAALTDVWKLDPALREPSTILVADDNEPTARLFSQLLGRDGHRVLQARDGAEAVRFVSEQRPDLVLMDVLMPTMDGFEACRQLKQDPATRSIPVVLVTALQDDRDRIRGLDSGADDFVSKPVHAAVLSARVRSLLRTRPHTGELDSAESIVLGLALTVEARDVATAGHCQRLAGYAARVGQELGLAAEDLRALVEGGFLHDIGKVGIPDAVLLKPSALTADEFVLMQRHTLIGDRLCEGLPSLQQVRPIVRHHHERLNGSGYPDGLRGRAIPLLAQIIGVVDVYDALTTIRPYKAAVSQAQAYDALWAEVGLGMHDPVLVEALIRALEKLPAAGQAQPQMRR